MENKTLYVIGAVYFMVNAFLVGEEWGRSSHNRGTVKGDIFVSVAVMLVGLPMFILSMIIGYGREFFGLTLQGKFYWKYLFTKVYKNLPEDRYLLIKKDSDYFKALLRRKEKVSFAQRHYVWIFENLLKRDGLIFRGDIFKGELDLKERTYRLTDIAFQMFTDEQYEGFHLWYMKQNVLHEAFELVDKGEVYTVAGLSIIHLGFDATGPLIKRTVLIKFNQLVKCSLHELDIPKEETQNV